MPCREQPPAPRRAAPGSGDDFAAQLIDALILAALVALGHSVGLASVTTYVGGGEATVEFGGGPLLLAAAYTLGFWATLQATPGKLAVGVRIVDAAPRAGNRA